MHPIDLQTKMEKTLPTEKKSKPPQTSFKDKKSSFKKDETPLQDEMIDSLRQLLATQKGISQPMTAPSMQATSISSANQSWQPSLQVVQLFEKMVDQLSYVHANGIQTTTVTLGGLDFDSSVFKGCTFTITEYSTAPKIFNIQFAMTPQAEAFFAPHAQQMQNALKQGEWDFKVERFDVELLDSKNSEEDKEEDQ